MKQLIIAALGSIALATSFGAAAHAAPWAKTYVVEWYEPAMYYGGKAGAVDPGSDCPTGAYPSPDWVKVLTKAGFSEKDAAWLRDPANPTHSPINGQPMMAFRGARHQDVYDYPTTTPENGLPPVSGAIAEGLNLDGDAKTGFNSPTGEKGVDNAFYKALGCTKSFRGPARLSDGGKGANDTMREGGWTVLVVISGEGADPLNDKAVKVGFYVSDDKIVRDGAGGVAQDYSFAIKPDPRFQAVFSGSTHNGQVVAKAKDTVWIRSPDGVKYLELAKAQLKLEIRSDGSLTGLVGGYRPWRPYYESLVNARGPVVEALGWILVPDVYYALMRYADYSPTGPKGEKTFISYDMRIAATPAYVLTPDAAQTVAKVKVYPIDKLASLPAAGAKPQAIANQTLKAPISVAGQP